MAPEFHLFLPQMRTTVDAIVDRALAAEAAGFDGMAFMDHLSPPLAVEHEMWEAMTIAGWVLARTTTLRVGHLVLCDAFRHPAVLARQAVSLDHASGGRFELGLGWGSVPSELATFGVGSVEPRHRVDRMADSLEVIRALWSGETVDHHGDYFTLVGARQRPVPSSHIPIVIGGIGPRTLDLVRRHADWWNVPLHQVGEIDRLRNTVGDARVSIQTMVALLSNEAHRADVTATVRRRFGETGMGELVVIGTADELATHFADRQRSGIDRFYVWFADFAPIDTIRGFAEVIAATR